jgi:hypothetical protein
MDNTIERCTLRTLMTEQLWKWASKMRIDTEFRYFRWPERNPAKATHVYFESFGGGDYVGDDLMAQANREYVLQELNSEAKEVFSESVPHLDYGYANFVLPLDVELDREQWELFVEEVRYTVEQYPSLDDDRLSTLEMECESAAWKDYGAHDTLRALRSKYGELIDNDALLSSAMALAYADPYGLFGQRLWSRLTENDSGWRETPGSTWIYPDPLKLWRDYNKIRDVFLTPTT